MMRTVLTKVTIMLLELFTLNKPMAIHVVLSFARRLHKQGYVINYFGPQFSELHNGKQCFFDYIAPADRPALYLETQSKEERILELLDRGEVVIRILNPGLLSVPAYTGALLFKRALRFAIMGDFQTTYQQWRSMGLPELEEAVLNVVKEQFVIELNLLMQKSISKGLEPIITNYGTFSTFERIVRQCIDQLLPLDCVA